MRFRLILGLLLLPNFAFATAVNANTNSITTDPGTLSSAHKISIVLDGVTTEPGALTTARKITIVNCIPATQMRGFSGATPVYWTSCGPDPLGYGSGYALGVLTDIVQLSH